MDGMLLSDAIDSADPLFENSWIPREFNIDDNRSCSLQI